MAMNESKLELELPGFRFHPTEEELLDFYLKRMVLGKSIHFDIIGFLNIYRHNPWELPGLAKIGEREWYFFVQRDRKHGSSGRPNRTTENGFWKATGSDRKIFSLSGAKRHIGLKKTLVFYKGRAPRGNKTDWIMNEYRLPDSCQLPKDIVLCKIYRKATSMKVLEQRAAMEEEMKTIINTAHSTTPPSPPPMDTISFCSHNDHDFFQPMTASHVGFTNKEDEDLLVLEEKVLKNEPEESDGNNNRKTSTLKLPAGNERLAELQLPKSGMMDWTQDQFWTTQLCSPWLENLILTPYANNNILNF